MNVDNMVGVIFLLRIKNKIPWKFTNAVSTALEIRMEWFQRNINRSHVNNRAVDHRVLKMQHRWCIWPLWTISFIKCLTRKVLGGFFFSFFFFFLLPKVIFFYKIYCLNWLRLWFRVKLRWWAVSSSLADRVASFSTSFFLKLFGTAGPEKLGGNTKNCRFWYQI